MRAKAPQALLLAVLLASLVQPAAQGSDVSRRGPVERAVTITFSHDVDYVPQSEVSCSLAVRRGSDGLEVLRAAVEQDCIQSFRTVREGRRLMLQCLNEVCAYLTNSPGIIPDTRWGVDWAGEQGSFYDSRSEYRRFGLYGFSASDGGLFAARLLFYG